MKMSKLRHLLTSETFSLRAIENELERGANPNEVSAEEGVCVMHLAAGLGSEAIGLLIQYGGDPNVRSIEGMTPLHVAASYGDLETLTLLLYNGANASIQDEDGKMPLDLAIENDHPLCAKELKIHTMLACVEDPPYNPRFSSAGLNQEEFHNHSCDAFHHCLNSSYIEPEFLSREYANTVTKKLYKYLSEGKKVCFNATSPTTPFVGYKSSCCKSHCGNIKDNGGKISSPLHHQCCDWSSPTHQKFINNDSYFCHEQNHSHSFTNRVNLNHSCNSHSCFHGEENDSQHCSPHMVLHGKPGCSCVGNISPQMHHQCYNNHCHASNQYRTSKCDTVLSQSPCLRSHSPKSSPRFMTSPNAKLDRCVQKNTALNESGDCPTIFEQKIHGANSPFTQNSPNSHKNLKVNLKEEESVHMWSNSKKDNLTMERNNHHQTVSKVKVISREDENESESTPKYFPAFSTTDSNSSSESKLSRVAEYVLSCADFSSKCDVNGTNLKGANFSISHDQPSSRDADFLQTVKGKLSPVDEKTYETEIKKTPKKDYEEYRNVCDISSSSDSFFTAGDDSNLSSPEHALKDSHVSESIPEDLLYNKGFVTSPNGNNLSNKNTSMRWHPPNLVQQNILDDSIMTSESSFLVPEKPRYFPKIHRKSFDKCMNDEKKNEFSNQNSDLSSELFKKRMELGYNLLSKQNKEGLLDDTLSSFSTITTKEYLYTDPEHGITLIEKRIPSECGSSIASRRSLDSMSSKFSQDSQATLIYDWRTLKNVPDSKLEPIVSSNNKCSTTDFTRPPDSQSSQKTIVSVRSDSHPASTSISHSDSDQTLELLEEDDEAEDDSIIPLHIKKLSNEQLSQELQKFGEMPGPVIASTRQVYLRRLASLESEPNLVRITKTCPDYPSELRQAMDGLFDWSNVCDLEGQMVDHFATSQGRQWREGCAKSSFTYMLLDPRVTNNLPLRAKDLSEQEVFKNFICAIFYIGKGKRARPYCHLYEAVSKMNKMSCKISAKVEHITDIWKDNVGVVSLHCFQSVIPVEAYTREACMLEAIGLYKVTNVKRGDFYGIVSTWPMRQRRRLGVYLLHKAMTIFLAEGERQICVPDLKSNSQ